MSFHGFANTAQFSYTARDWKKNGGKYTTAPDGSREWRQFWEEEERRCRYGYSVAGTYITGRHYGYLNFFPMSRVPDSVVMASIKEGRDKRGNLSVRTAEKIIGFPSFWEIDYEWWHLKHIAWYGGTFMGITSEGGRHMCCLKTRGAGFSYKEAWDGIYNYNFIDGSKSYYFAASEPFLIGDAILDKVQLGLDFINANSSYWKKNRQEHFNLMHQKASYIDSFGQKRGTNSEIIGQIVDKPKKTRGKRGRKATFEEAGAFPNLEAALEVCLGSMRDGGVYVGQVSVFGTGGETGPDVQGLENIFEHPEAWDMLGIPNIFEPNQQDTAVGYFVPCYRANTWTMDANGNVDINTGIKDENKERDKKASTGRPKDLDRRTAEYPFTPSEALKRLTGNGFNQEMIKRQIQLIETNKTVQGFIRHGKLVPSDAPHAFNGIEFVIQTKAQAKPIEDFPHAELDDLEGCVSILQEPFRDQKGNVPYNMYVITFDTYYKEDTQDTTSLFSIKVWKQENPYDLSYIDLPVAWFAGRTRTKRMAREYEILHMLCKMYNSQAQGEISGGGQGVVNDAREKKWLEWLHNEPDMVHNREVASKAAGTAYLMNMAGDRKKLGIAYLEDWHMQPRGVNDKGEMLYNIQQVYDIAFLKEMQKYNPENKKGNYDRISDAIIAMFMLRERRAKQVEDTRERSDMFNDERVLFGGTSASGTVSLYENSSGDFVSAYG